ncbi:penicillin acylase family protein [Thalassomonas sp. RHCl1]|uniref:penicillin acylase family protein n=1 Tax=Thalassomonas sp. RHCl1 TaxID=2995320 RepID=UPI00248BDF20|nr:penicillin acylase family protein [Thalassomonas sp. RHCl1]
MAESLPQLSGETSVTGIQAKVAIARSPSGIVNISAQSDNDAYFGLGYAHAQDRLWQLEVQRRIVQGRLSEVFGKSSVNRDIWFRTLSLYEKAADDWQVLTPKAQQALIAYSDGINAWLNQTGILPPEFALLDIQPEPWTPQDSLAWIKVFALNLSGNFRKEISRHLASQQLTPEQVATLFSDYPGNGPVTAEYDPAGQENMAAMLELQLDIEQHLQIGGKYVGTNVWAVSGQHSANGGAILANDPHLGLQIPSLWYIANLRGDKLNASGMTLVGLPLVIFGRNGHIAWGGSSMMGDNQDLFFEQINHVDNNLYLADGQWLPFDVKKEIIHVKQDFPAGLRKDIQPIEVNIRTGRHGPVISDVFKTSEQAVSLRWTALDDKDTSFQAFFDLNYAQDWAQFNAALKQHVAPNLNMLYADTQGNIGYLGIGHIPLRQTGKGNLPVPGWDNQYQWLGYIPVDEWPSSYNPPEGYIINANNKAVSADYPYFISQDWAPPARAVRIQDMLKQALQQGKLSAEQMQTIQADTLNLSSLALLPVFTKVTPATQTQEKALEYLRSWNGDMARDSYGATLYNTWLGFLREALFSDELTMQWGKGARDSFLRTVRGFISVEDIKAILEAKHSSDYNWCDKVNTQATESCEQILQSSLVSAISRLSKLQGSDTKDWQWGEVHHTSYQHTPFSSAKLLDAVFERRISNGGSPDSINVAVSSFEQAQGYLQTFGAGFRQIIDLSKADTRHLVMNSTGQSGNIMSRHYDDMVKPFRNVEMLEMSAEKPVDTLVLLPAKPGTESKLQ